MSAIGGNGNHRDWSVVTDVHVPCSTVDLSQIQGANPLFENTTSSVSSSVSPTPATTSTANRSGSNGTAGMFSEYRQPLSEEDNSAKSDEEPSFVMYSDDEGTGSKDGDKHLNRSNDKKNGTPSPTPRVILEKVTPPPEKTAQPASVAKEPDWITVPTNSVPTTVLAKYAPDKPFLRTPPQQSQPKSQPQPPQPQPQPKVRPSVQPPPPQLPPLPPQPSGKLFDDNDKDEDNESNVTSIVAMVDKYITKEEPASTTESDKSKDAEIASVSKEPPLPVQDTSGDAAKEPEKSDKPDGDEEESQNDTDEVQLVEGGDEDGELVKESGHGHGTNSATFLSQMKFFGGRTWRARGRGRGRGKGRGRYKQAKNIALKLIESDIQGVVDEKDEQTTRESSRRQGRSTSKSSTSETDKLIESEIQSGVGEKGDGVVVNSDGVSQSKEGEGNVPAGAESSRGRNRGRGRGSQSAANVGGAVTPPAAISSYRRSPRIIEPKKKPEQEPTEAKEGRQTKESGEAKQQGKESQKSKEPKETAESARKPTTTTTDTEEPAETTEKHATTTEKDALTTEKPAEITEKPTAATENPTTTTEEPTETTESPTKELTESLVPAPARPRGRPAKGRRGKRGRGRGRGRGRIVANASVAVTEAAATAAADGGGDGFVADAVGGDEGLESDEEETLAAIKTSLNKLRKSDDSTETTAPTKSAVPAPSSSAITTPSSSATATTALAATHEEILASQENDLTSATTPLPLTSPPAQVRGRGRGRGRKRRGRGKNSYNFAKKSKPSDFIGSVIPVADPGTVTEPVVLDGFAVVVNESGSAAFVNESGSATATLVAGSAVVEKAPGVVERDRVVTVEPVMHGSTLGQGLKLKIRPVPHVVPLPPPPSKGSKLLARLAMDDPPSSTVSGLRKRRAVDKPDAAEEGRPTRASRSHAPVEPEPRPAKEPKSKSSAGRKRPAPHPQVPEIPAKNAAVEVVPETVVVETDAVVDGSTTATPVHSDAQPLPAIVVTPVVGSSAKKGRKGRRKKKKGPKGKRPVAAATQLFLGQPQVISSADSSMEVVQDADLTSGADESPLPDQDATSARTGGYVAAKDRSKSPVVKLTKISPRKETAGSRLLPPGSRSQPPRSSLLPARLRASSVAEPQPPPTRPGASEDVAEGSAFTAVRPSQGRRGRRSQVAQESPVAEAEVEEQPEPAPADVNSILNSAASATNSRARGKHESLTRSVGSMMSHLFGDNLQEQCPDGFVVNVRLEVEKKNNSVAVEPSQDTCCSRGKKPEACPCLPKLSDVSLLKVLQRRVQHRQDLSTLARSTIMDMVTDLMQELQGVSPS